MKCMQASVLARHSVFLSVHAGQNGLKKCEHSTLFTQIIRPTGLKMMLLFRVNIFLRNEELHMYLWAIAF